MRIRFGRFTLDLDTRQLTQADRKIHLAPKAFELLAALVVDRPKVPPRHGERLVAERLERPQCKKVDAFVR